MPGNLGGVIVNRNMLCHNETEILCYGSCIWICTYTLCKFPGPFLLPTFDGLLGQDSNSLRGPGSPALPGGGGHQPTHRPTHASPPPNWDVKVPPKNLGSKRRRWFYKNTTVVISERAGRMFLCNG